MARNATGTLHTDPWGIDNGYEDALHKWQDTPARTRAAILAAMDADPSASRPPSQHGPRVVTQGAQIKIDQPGELRLEDGTVLKVDRDVPPDVPLGYHTLHSADGKAISFIVTPATCFLPENLCTWGWAVQLYAVRSKQSWGMGDLADLRELTQWSADQQAGTLLMNPINSVTPIPGQQPSPYYPTTRRFRNPLYLRVEEMPGAKEARVDLEPLAAAGRALNSNRIIDREAIFRLKDQAFRKIWAVTKPGKEHQRFCEEGGASLHDYATFCALAEKHGHDWRRWPAEHRRPDSPAVKEFAKQNADSINYHCWLQWQLNDQLAKASANLRVMQDLPIGVDPGGVDAWAWQDVLAKNVSVGAPPDIYNSAGQNWGLPPFIPHKLRAAGYVPFIETIRSALQHAGALRIDHVMGMFRLFWIPQNMGAGEGAFVRYPADDLLGIIALESQRAGAFIVGEDLGTVEPQVRQKLGERKILSYRLLWFEEQPPSEFPNLALAAVTTHDLPTIAGLWTRADIEAEKSAGKSPNVEAVDQIRSRLKDMIGVADDAPVDEVIEKTHELLAEAPSAMITATLDDALAVEERPNMPGTVNEWPNWSIALPKTLEEIKEVPLAHRIAAKLANRSKPAAVN